MFQICDRAVWLKGAGTFLVPRQQHRPVFGIVPPQHAQGVQALLDAKPAAKTLELPIEWIHHLSLFQEVHAVTLCHAPFGKRRTANRLQPGNPLRFIGSQS